MVLLSVLIFSKPTRACAGIPSSKHVCRPLALARPTPCILVQRLTQGVPIISTLPRSPLAVAINALRKRESRQRAKQLKKNIMVEEGSSGRDSLQEHGFSRVGSDECKTLRAQGPPTLRLKVAEQAALDRAASCPSQSFSFSRIPSGSAD